MEYLTLQDIPHRHCNPVHSHRMASQSSERPGTHMAAVRCIYSYPPESDSTPSSLLLPMHEPLVSYGYASRHDSIERAKVLAMDSSGPQELKEITLPMHPPPPASPHTPEHQSRGDALFMSSLESDMNIWNHDDPPIRATRPGSSDEQHRYNDWAITKTESQPHLQRNSPPLQPGEQNFPGKLPSFDEVSASQTSHPYDTNDRSSSKQLSRGHHHTLPQGETSLQRTRPMSDPSLKM
jgi:hypothetical protein